MALVVEDGTGRVDSESYISVVDADIYISKYGLPLGLEWPDNYGIPEKEIALRLGTQYIDEMYRARWKGFKNNIDNALLWPRSGVEVDGRFGLESAVIPVNLQRATAEAATRVSIDKILFPDVTSPGTMRSKLIKIDGAITVRTDYVGGSSDRKRYTIIDELLADLLRPGGKVLRS